MKKLIFVALFVAAIAVTPVSAQTIPAGQTLEGYIAGLRASIERMTRELNQLLAQQQGGWCYDFNHSFGVGEKGEIVDHLVKNLKPEISASYTEFNGNVLAWVKEFQTKYGIPSTGYVGVLTRAKLNELYGCQTKKPDPIIITSPKGGESWVAGDTERIRWDASGLGERFAAPKFDLYLDPIQPVIHCPATMMCAQPQVLRAPYLLDKTIAGTSYDWIVATEINSDTVTIRAGNYKIRVCEAGTSNCGSSATPFTITAVPSSLTVTSPNGGETWTTYNTKDITWNWPGAKSSDKVDLYLTVEPPVCIQAAPPCYPTPPLHSTYLLDKNISARLTYHWIVGTDIDNKLIPPSNYRVRVCQAGTNVCDTSDNYFTITSPVYAEPQ